MEPTRFFKPESNRNSSIKIARTKNKIQLSVLVLGALGCTTISASAAEKEAFFCSSCTSISTAEQLALTEYAPKKICYSSDPSQPLDLTNQVCGGKPRNIVLVNPDTYQSYYFYVGISKHFPFSPIALPQKLTPVEADRYEAVVDYYHTLKNTMAYASITASEMLNADTENFQKVSPSYSYNGAAPLQTDNIQCPTGTAFDVINDYEQLSKLKDKITLAVSAGLPLKNVTKDNIEQVRTYGTKLNVGLSYGGITLNWSKDTSEPVISAIFRKSEGSASIPDVLVFTADLAGWSADGIALLDLRLSDSLSRVGGMRLNDLKGTGDGLPKVTNKCLLQKMDKLAKSNSDTQPKYGGIGGENADLGPYIDDPFSISNGWTCTIHFYQSGRLLYKFIVPGACR